MTLTPLVWGLLLYDISTPDDRDKLWNQELLKTFVQTVEIGT